MKKIKQAFTLSEVLLVLAIIGVIASVTIPATMQQSSIKKFSALTRKAQTTLQTAIDVKKSLVPYGPGDLSPTLTIIQWLAEGENMELSSLKYVKETGNFYSIQTPDGMIIHPLCGTCPHLRNRRAVCQSACGVRIDLNGAEGPTKTTMNNMTPLNNAANDVNAYDTVYFNVGGTGDRVVPGGLETAERDRTRKYLDMQ